MLPAADKIREIDGAAPGALTDAVLTSTQPLVLRNLMAQWPMVQAGLQSMDAGDAYLRRFYRDATVVAMLGAPEIEGRFFYNEDLSGFNFEAVRVKLNTVLDEIKHRRNEETPPAIYVGSTTVETCLPGFLEENPIDLGGRDALMSVWIGNRSRIAAHYDLPDNLAVVAAGRRRFTLFAPEQVHNLYMGPLDPTPAGQPVSLVDFAAPDFDRFPRFSQALAAAQVAELAPGDAVFIPSMWFHHVEGLTPVNLLINAWWRQTPDYVDSPLATLRLALMTLRDLPEKERRIWQHHFQHFVFEADATTWAHIPSAARGLLGPIDDTLSRQARAQLLTQLKR